MTDSGDRVDEITRRLATIDVELSSLRDRISQAVGAKDDAPGGNLLIASVFEKLGMASPTGVPKDTPTLGQIEALEKEREELQQELAQLRPARSDRQQRAS